MRRSVLGAEDSIEHVCFYDQLASVGMASERSNAIASRGLPSSDGANISDLVERSPCTVRPPF